MIDAVILAGAKNNKDLKNYSDVEYEALINIQEKPMVEYVLKAVQQADLIDNVILVGPPEQLKQKMKLQPDQIIKAQDSLTTNIKNGVAALNTNNDVLLSTGDIPLLTSQAVDDFIKQCQQYEGDLFYPFITKKDNDDSFLEGQRTYVNLSEGKFTGGNLLMIKQNKIDHMLEWFDKAYSWRKSPLKLSHMLGVKCIFKYLLGWLSINEIEQRVLHLTGCKGKAVLVKHPEICFDVDKLTDLKLVKEQYLL